MKKCTLSCLMFLFSFLTIFNLSAQQVGVKRCATMEEDAIRRANNPELGTLSDFEDFLQAEIQKKQLAAQTSFIVGDVYIIPVVVHIIHDNEAVGTGLNISYDRINDQIQTLQNDFRKIAGSPGDNTHPAGADTKIEFRLAKQMPNGTAFAGGEDGVNRIYWDDIPNIVSANVSTSEINNFIKPYTNGQGWDPTRYMNFWVCDIGGGVLGYAQFPSGGLPGMGCSNPDPVTDGVVMTTSSVGGSTFTSGAGPYNIGRTATHEIGHWLGLRHTWGDGGCGIDDFCADTPEASSSNFGCATGNVSCGSIDMVENYMDYSDDACMNIFTNDQSIRMRTVLETTPVRSQLIQSTTWQDPIANSALVKHINSPFYELCTGSVEPKVLVSNVGTNILNDVTIEYTIDGTNIITTSFTGLGIAQGATTTLTLGTSTVALGDHNISVKVTAPTVQATPETRSFTYTLGFGLPFEESFDNSASFPPASWQLGSSNNCFIWGPGSGVGSDGNNTQAASVDNRNSNVVGEKAFLYTPILTMPCGAQNVRLDFDIAYKERNGDPTEGLEVEVSTDCGNSWQATTYSEFGNTLSNSTQQSSAYFPTAAAEWRHKTVNLDAFVNVGADNQMLLRFVATNEFGNNLYVDNIKVDAQYSEVAVFLSGTEIYGGTTSDFGTSPLNTQVVKTHTVKNTGTATLNLTSQPSITGTEFTVGNFGVTTLTSGASTTFDVTYLAASQGVFTETISFNTDDCNEATFSFDVKGEVLITCVITDLTAGAQTACVPLTNKYTQEVVVTYNDAPSSGNLVVAGQNFAITASPQTVTLINLDSDGNAVNVTANFSANTSCERIKNSLFTAPVNCIPVCAISDLAAGVQSACDVITNKYTQEVVVTYNDAPSSGNLVVAGQSFAITTSPQTVTLTNLDSDGNAVNVTANFSANVSCERTENNLFTAPVACVPCGITNLVAATQTVCDPLTNKYTQTVTVTYSNLGAPTSGDLVVAGQNFAITASPQTVTLTGLTSDGNAVDVNAHFSALVTCSATAVGLFTAPADCSAPEITLNVVTNGNLLNLGNTLIGTNLTKTIIITNDGSANLDIASLSISGHPDITILNPLTTPLSILPSQTENFTVQVDATVVGLKTATIIIVNNDADEANFTFDVRGLVNATPPPPPPPAIDYTINRPTNLTGVSVSTSQINLTWLDNSNNEDGFYVYQNGVLIATLTKGTSSFEVLGLNTDTFYTFKVTAFNVQKRANTNSLNISTLPNTPSLVESIGVCQASGVAYLKLENSPEGGSYRWYADAAGGTPLAEVTQGYFQTPIITQTTTFYATAVSSKGLESSPRIAVQAEVFEAVTAQITEGKTVLSCDNQATLHAVPQTGATYQWKVNGILSPETGQALLATSTGNYELIVNRNSCSDSYYFSLTLNYKPRAIIQNGTSIDFCQSGTLSASNTTSNATYQWLLNGSVIGSGTSTSVSQSGTYTLKATENTCTNEAQIVVNVFNLPQNQAVAASATQFCVGDVAELSVPVMSGINYRWFRNGIQISGARSETYTAFQGGDYSVQMSVDGLNCEVMSQVLTLSWFVSPEVKLTKNDKTLTLEISVPHQSVEWFKTGAELLPQFANQTSLSSPPFDTYWAVVIYPTGCKVTSNSIRFFEAGPTTGGGGQPPVGLDDDETEGNTFEVFPNPSENGIFQIRLNNPLITDAQLKLSDALGRDLNFNMTVKQGTQNLELNLSDFANGVYHLQFISNEGTLTKKIIKQ